MHGLPLHPGRADGVITRESAPQPVRRPSVLVASNVTASALATRVSQGYVGAILAAKSISGVGSSGLPANFPVLGGLASDLFEDGERCRIDGEAGSVELDGVTQIEVVTSFLQNSEGRVLLLRRSDRVGSFQGRWAGVSGFLEDPTPEQQARREIHEETGFSGDDVVLEANAAPVYARDGKRIFVVYPFRFRVLKGTVRLDWEHTEYEWVLPRDIGARPTVPKLVEVWETVAPRPPSSTTSND